MQRNRAKTLRDYALALAVTLTKRCLQNRRDAKQQAELLVLESGKEALFTDELKSRLNAALSEYVTRLRPTGLPLNAVVVDTGSRTRRVYRLVDVRDRLLVPTWRSRLPRTRPKTKEARLARKRKDSNKCRRCGKVLPDSEYTRCEFCRAKEHRYYLVGKRGSIAKSRNKSKYEQKVA